MEKQLGRNSPCLLTLVDLLNQKYEFTNITKLAGFAQNLIKVRDGGRPSAIFLTGILLSCLGVICSDNSGGKRDG
jgi:hypothetical protein